MKPANRTQRVIRYSFSAQQSVSRFTLRVPDPVHPAPQESR
jgi:hypothetical protein